MTVAERLEVVRRQVARAAARGGRAAADVTIVAVTKGFSAGVIADAVRAGAVDLGENRAQELREKAIAVTGDVRWHFIGHLQTNKARHVVGLATVIHSVDRLALADEVARRARSAGFVQEVLVEVNIAGEASKHGVEPARAAALAREVAALDGLAVRGLMAMAPLADDPERSRPYFKDLRGLGEEVAAEVPGATQLSMGMSRDFEVAVEEGATLVRVGEAIFGPRRPR
ncbi:MAG TPA: YggS family pyridoxal phosphate-dependent enzyme [Actinomycetota bacterium]|nr:YggS family pyridoxal phosphate-dependent enzyme [Actinomycetota bacterium]